MNHRVNFSEFFYRKESICVNKHLSLDTISNRRVIRFLSPSIQYAECTCLQRNLNKLTSLLVPNQVCIRTREELIDQADEHRTREQLIDQADKRRIIFLLVPLKNWRLDYSIFFLDDAREPGIPGHLK